MYFRQEETNALLATGSDDCAVKLWAWRGEASSRETTAIPGHVIREHAGRWLLGCGLHGHSGRISGLSFSKGGRLLASCDSDGNVLLWCEKVGGSNWGEGRIQAGKMRGWTLQGRLRHPSQVGLKWLLHGSDADLRV